MRSIQAITNSQHTFRLPLDRLDRMDIQPPDLTSDFSMEDWVNRSLLDAETRFDRGKYCIEAFTPRTCYNLVELATGKDYDRIVK